MNATQPWVVLTVDIVSSQQVENLRDERDRRLADLSRRQLEQGRILTRYTVTSWDEFQTVLSDPRELPTVAWELRLAFHPHMELKIGIGVGEINEVPGPDTPINETSSGTAFVRAREALDSLEESRKFPRLTAVRADDEDLEGWMNLVFMLQDTLLVELSDRQWETVREYERAGSLEAATAQLEVRNQSTVSRNLQRAHYWQLLAAKRQMGSLLHSLLASSHARKEDLH